MTGAFLALLLLQSARGEDFAAVFQKALDLARQAKDLESLEAFRAAERLAPDDPWVHFNIGIILGRQGQTAGSLECFRRAVEIAPGERRLQEALGEAAYRSGQIAEAVSALERAAEPPEPSAQAVSSLAAAYEALGRKEEALATLARYVELRPEDLAARLQLGHQLVAAGRREEGVEVWKRGAEEPAASAKTKEASLRAELFFRLGELTAHDGARADEAESYLRNALAVDPSHLGARVLLARLLARAGRLEEATQEIEQALRVNPESPEPYFVQAAILQQLGRAEAAEAARLRFQQASAEAQRREDGEKRLKASYKTARDLLDQGRMTEAEAAFQATLELDPANAQIQAMLGKIAYSGGRLPEARQWITRAIASDGTVGEYHYLAALFAARAGETAAAEQAGRRSLSLAPGFADAWLLLGSLLVDSGRAGEALDCFLKAEALEPQNPAVQLNLASAYHHLGTPEQEQKAMERYRTLAGQKAK